MKKGIAKSLYSFGTAVLAFGTLASAGMPIVSATTVSSSQAESAQTVVSASKKSQDSLSNAKQSSRILTSIASRQGVKSSANNVETQTQASTSNAKATQSSAAHSSIMMMRLDATKGSYMITGTMPNTNHPQDGWEAYGPQRNGEIVYCYDPDNYNPSNNNDGNGQPVDPNAPLNTVSYNRSDLWNGSEAQGYSAASVDKVAAVLYAGYPNNIGGKQHNGPISQSQVDQWYEQYCANHQYSTNPSDKNYLSEAQYEYDRTQEAIWGVEGDVPGDNVTDPQNGWSTQYQKDPLSRALYNYATQHPLDAKNAAQNGVTLENAQGKPMGASDTLTVDPKTHESEGFQVKGGDVTLPTSTNGYHVVNAQGQTVTTLEPGETYHVVFSPSTDPAKVNMMCPYLHVATADYYHSDDPASTGIKGQKPWQNMVGLTTNMASIAINFKMGSESSSIASTKSSVQSSVKSSSTVKSSSKKSSSSVKSSSAVKSSSKKSSSSVKSSSAVKSSSKKSSSSVKSSSAVKSSSKKSSSSVKSSSAVKSSSKKSSSSVKSSSAVKSSSKKSSSSVKSSSAVKSSSKKSSSSVKSSSAVKSSSKKSSSSVKSSSAVKSSSKKSSSSVKSSSAVKSSSKKSSSSVKSSSAVKSSSKKSSSSVKSSSAVKSSSKKSSNSAKSSSVASSKKATATTSSETTKNSSSKATKTTSSVASAKKTSSSVSTKAATSSSNNTTSAKKGVVAGVANHSSNSGKGTGHGQGKGEGHGMPQTGEAVATSLIAAGVVLLAAAGAITLRKRN